MNGDRLRADIEAEFESHVELAAFHAEGSGLTRVDARRLAEERFGDRTRLIREVQDVHRSAAVVWGTRLFQSMAIAIPLAVLFASTGLIAGIQLRTPRSFHTDGQWVSIWQPDSAQGGRQTTLSSAAEYTQLLVHDNLFSNLTASRYETRIVTAPVSGRPARIKRVTADYLKTIGVTPLLGSDVPSYDHGRPVVHLSHRVWSEWFAADPHVIGKELELDGGAHTIIGVVPSNVSFYYETDLLAPLSLTEETVRARRRLLVGGRLNAGMNIRDVNATLRSLFTPAPIVKAASVAFGVPFASRAYALVLLSVVLSIWAFSATMPVRPPRAITPKWMVQRLIGWPVGPGVVAAFFGSHYLTRPSAVAIAGDTAHVFDVSISPVFSITSVLAVLAFTICWHHLRRLFNGTETGRRAVGNHSPGRWLAVQLAVGSLLFAIVTTYAIESINSRPGLPKTARGALYVTAFSADHGSPTSQARATPNTREWALTGAIPGLDGRNVLDVRSTYAPGPSVRVGVNTVSSDFFAVTGISLESGSTFREGNPTAWTVIVDRTLALSAFGRSDVVGRWLTIGQSEVPARVIGVAKPVRYGPNRLPTLYQHAVGTSDASLFVSRSSEPTPSFADGPLRSPLLAERLVDDASRQFNATILLMTCLGIALLVLMSREVFLWSARLIAGYARDHTLRRFFGASRTHVGMRATLQIMWPVGIGIFLAGLAGWLLAPQISIDAFSTLFIGLTIAFLFVTMAAVPALVSVAHQVDSALIGLLER